MPLDHAGLFAPQTAAETLPAIAAITHRLDEPIAPGLLADLARDWLASGVRVRGLVDVPAPGGGKCGGALRDVESGADYPIFQDLGPGSDACSIDSSAVVAASVVLERAAVTGADLVLANRFGKLEAAGGGLAAGMLAVMAAGIPFLTLVAEPWLERWLEFTGGAGVRLSAERAALDRWARRALASTRT